MIIDAELKQIAAALATLDHQTEVCKACLAELDRYDEDWEEPEAEPQPGFQIIDLRGYEQTTRWP